MKNIVKLSSLAFVLTFCASSAYADVLPVPAQCPALSKAQGKTLANEGRVYLNVGGQTNPGNPNNATMMLKGSAPKYSIFKSPGSIESSAPTSVNKNGLECSYKFDGQNVDVIMSLDSVNTFAVAAAPVAEVAPAPEAPAPAAPAPAPAPAEPAAEPAPAAAPAPTEMAAEPAAAPKPLGTDGLMKEAIIDKLIETKDPSISAVFASISAAVTANVNKGSKNQCLRIVRMCKDGSMFSKEDDAKNCQEGGKNFEACKLVDKNLELIAAELEAFKASGSLGKITLTYAVNQKLINLNEKTPEPDDVEIQMDRGY